MKSLHSPKAKFLVITDVKVELSLCFLTEHHTMKAYWGSRSVAPRILDLGSTWK
jgi:hypothetical protein